MKKYYIYTKEAFSNLVDSVYLLNKEQIKQAYPNFNSELHVLSETKFNHAIYENGNLREATQTELKEANIIELESFEFLDENGKLQLTEEYLEQQKQAELSAKIAQIKANAEQEILEKYPYWKQMNILRQGSEEQKFEMTMFIDYTRALSDEAERELTANV